MNDKIKAARVALGSFLKERRKQMGRTEKELAEFLKLSAETVKGVEDGRFAADIDTIFRFCKELELKPYFAPLENIGGGTAPQSAGLDKFLMAPNSSGDQLYILHRQYPACLIQVIPTTPATFRIVDLYDKIEEEELVTHPFMEDAKNFWRQYGEKSNNTN